MVAGGAARRIEAAAPGLRVRARGSLQRHRRRRARLRLGPQDRAAHRHGLGARLAIFASLTANAHEAREFQSAKKGNARRRIFFNSFYFLDYLTDYRALLIAHVHLK